MAAGKPIITMLNGAGSDVVKDAKCGLTCKSEDYRQLAENVKMMYSMDKAKIAEMGRNAYLYYKENFDKDLVIDKICDILYS